MGEAALELLGTPTQVPELLHCAVESALQIGGERRQSDHAPMDGTLDLRRDGRFRKPVPLPSARAA